MMEEQTSRQPGTSPATDMRDLRPLSTLRIPLLILFLSTVFATNVFPLPFLWVLCGGAVIGGSAALFFERRLMLELLRWRCFQAAIAPFAGIVLYALADLTLQVVAASAMGGPVLDESGAMPLIFAWFVDLRARVGETGPVALGLLLSFVLAAGQESFFRGLVFTRLMLHAGHGLAVLISAGLSALLYFFALGYLAGLLAFPVGIALGLFTLQSRSIVPAILCQMSILLLALWIRPDFAAMAGL